MAEDAEGRRWKGVLRRIVERLDECRDYADERLECGHSIRIYKDHLGKIPKAQSRHCRQCMEPQGRVVFGEANPDRYLVKPMRSNCVRVNHPPKDREEEE